jgi:hypothetical protein
MILAQYKTLSDDALKVDAFLYDILSEELTGDMLHADAKSVKDLPIHVQKKITMLEKQYANLYSKRNFKIYKLISDYIGFYIANISTSEQVETLIQATNHYSQRLIDNEILSQEYEEED